jgi:hypothetical protein
MRTTIALIHGAFFKVKLSRQLRIVDGAFDLQYANSPENIDITHAACNISVENTWQTSPE